MLAHSTSSSDTTSTAGPDTRPILEDNGCCPSDDDENMEINVDDNDDDDDELDIPSKLSCIRPVSPGKTLRQLLS